MKKNILKEKIINSIASKIMSDNLIYLSIAVIKHNDYLVNNNKDFKYGDNMIYLIKAGTNNNIDKHYIGKKVHSITIENYTDCISLEQALKISEICNNGDYTYDKNYIPDAVCGFVSDEEYTTILENFDYAVDAVGKHKDITDNTTTKNKFTSKEEIFMKRHYEIIDTLIPYIWNNKRVVLTTQIAQVFGMSKSMFLGRFYKLYNNFKPEKDYYLLTGIELNSFYGLNKLNIYTSSLYIWTQSGVALFAQLTDSDKYLNLYQYMVHKYFSVDIENDTEETNDTVSNDLIKINDTELMVKMYRNQRVVIFKDIDAVHSRPEGTARKRFNDNKKHFIEGEDYFKVKCSEVRPFFGQTLPSGFNPEADIVLLTESGYLMIVKSFTDDLAWDVQRQLVKSYFRLKEYDENKENYVNNFRHYTSSTKIPKINTSLVISKFQQSKDWYYNNYNKIESVLAAFGWEHSYLYHIILKTIGQTYDLQAAKKIYEKELGVLPEYAMDIIEYFDELSINATEILNKLVNGISN